MISSFNVVLAVLAALTLCGSLISLIRAGICRFGAPDLVSFVALAIVGGNIGEVAR